MTMHRSPFRLSVSHPRVERSVVFLHLKEQSKKAKTGDPFLLIATHIRRQRCGNHWIDHDERYQVDCYLGKVYNTPFMTVGTKPHDDITFNTRRSVEYSDPYSKDSRSIELRGSFPYGHLDPTVPLNEMSGTKGDRAIVRGLKALTVYPYSLVIGQDAIEQFILEGNTYYDLAEFYVMGRRTIGLPRPKSDVLRREESTRVLKLMRSAFELWMSVVKDMRGGRENTTLHIPETSDQTFKEVVEYAEKNRTRLHERLRKLHGMYKHMVALGLNVPCDEGVLRLPDACGLSLDSAVFSQSLEHLFKTIDMN